jgi:isoamylase
MADQLVITAGRAQPLGATVDANGVNFSVYSEHATSAQLLLFADHDEELPSQVIDLDPEINHSFHFWHAHVSDIGPGQIYAYRMDGPKDTSRSGCRFNPNKVLIDPYALGNVNTLWDRGQAVGPQDNVTSSMRSIVLDPDDYDWEDDVLPDYPMSESIIYEMHVRGFTKSPTSGVANPGTFAGIVEKIPYLKSLGVTAIELLPIYDFDESQVLRNAPDGTPLHNFWGYDPYGHFAPQYSYCVEPEEGAHLTEFRDMVKALHKEGIEVILDVVYNHTSEGNQNGPTISFRGMANEAYYHLVPHDRQYYMDFSGCGNTFNANHPVVTKYIIESLEYWVTECHVDGFRFDLGSVLSRGPDGGPMDVPPVLWNIELSKILSETKVIAEAWDAGGLYQVGRFPGERWCEWNGPYRDDIRRFLRGEPGIIPAVATRIAGSEDLFGAQGERPSNSINFITCHDGFTLNDLVSYNSKHNEANGEQNRDGSDDNRSWNCGVEGPTDDADIEALRNRQVKNAVVILMVSKGTPMLLGGDEFRRTQMGNNNAYCQDNEISWFDWSQAEENSEMVRFFSGMIAFRRRHSVFAHDDFFTGAVNERGRPDVAWHGCRLNQPGWTDPMCRVLSFTVAGRNEDPDIHVMLNMYDLGLDFDLPQFEGLGWAVAVDTGKPAPADIADPGSEVPVQGSSYHVFGRSAVVLVSQPGGKVRP